MKDLTHVGELEVVAREDANIPSPNDPAKSVTTQAIHQLLLSDGSIVFQCMHRNDGDCMYTAPAAKSVASHQRTHSDRLLAKRAIAEAEAVKNELAERIKRRSEGSKKGMQTRKLQTASTSPTGTPPPTSSDLTKAVKRVQITANALDDAIEEHRVATLHLITIAGNMPELDPQIIAKATAYDEFKTKMFNV
jgi:hypothetical protein